MMDTAALALVEENIVKQKVVLSRLYTQKNSFSFISCLPNETLANIFILCASDEYYRDKDRYWKVLPEWFNVSYVCCRWRDIALNCATLWTYIIMMSPRWIEELLERSKKASLKIRICIPEYTSDVSPFLNSAKRALDHAECIQELQLSFPSGYADQVFSGNLSLHIPRVQILNIISTLYSSSPPFVPFDGDTPLLHSLKLENIRVPFSSLNTRNLRTLRLHCTSGPFQEDMKDFLFTLGYMDNLAHLWLYRAFSCCQSLALSSASSASPKIRLPRLSQLLIAGNISTVATLLSSLDFPLKAEVQLDYQYDDESFEGYALFTSVLARKYTGIMSADQELTIPAIHSLVIKFTGRSRRLTFSTSEPGLDSDYPGEQGWNSNAPLQITLPNLVSLDKHTSDICCALPLTHLRNVHTIGPPSSLDFWERSFGHLQDLRYIKLSRGVMPNLASILVVDGLAENDDTDQIFAPALEVLELCNLTFPAWFDEATFGPDLQSLRDALATREEPEVQLIMSGCYEDLPEKDDSYLCRHCGCYQ